MKIQVCVNVKVMKKPLIERFQQLAGIKPLYELEDIESSKDFDPNGPMKGKEFKEFYPELMQGGKGTSRKNMPQVPVDDFEGDLGYEPPDGIETNEPEKIPDIGKATSAYLDSSDDLGQWPQGDQVEVHEIDGINPTELTPTQQDIYMDNALKKVGAAESGEWEPWDAAVLASNDGYILDGHHRWAATIVYNDKHNDNKTMTIQQVQMPIDNLLKVANAYTDAHPDAKRASGGETTV